MKNYEFYNKHKAHYPLLVNPLLSRRSWWPVLLITIAALLIGPLIVYKYQRSVPLSLTYYFKLIGYFLFFVVPCIALLVWIDRREFTKRSRGYEWVGKFQVISKRSTFISRYLLLAPGNSNRLRVNRSMFEKTRVGDFILIRRDSLGSIEEIRKIKDFSSRLAKARGNRFQRSIDTIS